MPKNQKLNKIHQSTNTETPEAGWSGHQVESSTLHNACVAHKQNQTGKKKKRVIYLTLLTVQSRTCLFLCTLVSFDNILGDSGDIGAIPSGAQGLLLTLLSSHYWRCLGDQLTYWSLNRNDSTVSRALVCMGFDPRYPNPVPAASPEVILNSKELKGRNTWSKKALSIVRCGSKRKKIKTTKEDFRRCEGDSHLAQE